MKRLAIAGLVLEGPHGGLRRFPSRLRDAVGERVGRETELAQLVTANPAGGFRGTARSGADAVSDRLGQFAFAAGNGKQGGDQGAGGDAGRKRDQGRFVEGGYAVGSWPGLGSTWATAPADERGTYKVVRTGVIELSYADGTKERHVIGIQHDPQGKPNPAVAGVLLGDKNFYD